MIHDNAHAIELCTLTVDSVTW